MNFIKFTRLRWRTRSLVLYTMLLLAILQVFPLANAVANAKSPQDGDYGSDGDTSDASGTNDEIYEQPQLQEEVETSERRAHEDENESDAVSEAVTKMVPSPFTMRKMSNNHIERAHIANEHENNTEEEEEHRRSTSSEEYSDELNAKKVPKTVMRRPALTTIPPEYVHQVRTVKKQQHNEANVAESDYTEETEEQIDNLDEQTNKYPYPEFARRKKTFNEQNAMKFHPNARSDGIAEERKHKQFLPKQQNARKFNVVAGATQNDEESQYDEYYEDNDDTHNRKDKAINRFSNQQKLNIPQQRRTTFSPVLGPNFAMPLVPTWTEQNEIENKTITTIEPITAGIVAAQAPSPSTLTSTTPPAAAPPSSIATTSTSTSTSQTPIIPYGTTLPTPLALGPFKTTTASTTGLPATLSPPSVISATPDIQVPATTTSSTMRPGGKQGKQINISRRKLQPHEKLRNYIEDAYIRMPLAVIVDPSSESLEKTKALWRDALRTNFNIKIVLVSLNASGVPSAYNFNNTRQFLTGLNSIKEHPGGDAFIGVVHASELVPYDSAVFISTASLPPHTELVQDAAITLLKKRIRLYLLWFGERSLSENETQEAVGGILGEVAIRSGGDILHIVGSENSQELEAGNTLVLVADAFRGAQEIEIPVDTTLSSLHVKIDAPTRTVTLETPNDDINLKKFFKLKSHTMFTKSSENKQLDAYVPLTKLRKASIFTLRIVPESLEDEYNVFVRADRKADHFLEDMIKRFDAYFMEGISYNPIRFRENRLQSITTALEAVIPTHDNLIFPDDVEQDHIEHNSVDPDRNNENKNKKEPKTEVETFSATEVHGKPNDIEITNAEAVNASRTFGNQQQQARNLLQMSVTKIEMGVQSQVLVAPGAMSQLIFELTNTRSEVVYHNIQVVDERKYLLRLVPQNIFLRPGETATVTVTVLVPQGTPKGTIDRITFTCHGSGTASLSLNLKVTTSVDAQDTVPPTVTWNFGSRCDSIAADSPSCAERFWTLDVTAQDWETGILRLQSTPTNRLYYRNFYTVGSTEPLKATYAATCCEPRVSLLAYDIAGNQRSHNIDVRDIVLTEASIAAIVLGSLLLLLLIVLLILGIVYCCRRRKVTLDLPTYRSHSTRSME